MNNVAGARRRPLVSVVVPVYRVEPYLRRCLDSVLAQTHDRLEIIVVDDGSPDGCPAIVDEYAARDPRIVPVHQHNQGLGAARNTGLALARGDFVAFVDSDDRVHRSYVATLLDRCLATGADIAVCGFSFDYPSGLRLPAPLLCLRGRLTGRQAAHKALSMFTLPNFACNKLFRRDFLLRNEVAFPSMLYEDVAIMPGVVRRAALVATSRRPLYRYHQRRTSITGSFGERNIEQFLLAATMVRDDLEACAEGDPWGRHYRRFLSRAWLYLAVSIARHPQLSPTERLAVLQRTHARLVALRQPGAPWHPPTIADVAAAACGLLLGGPSKVGGPRSPARGRRASERCPRWGRRPPGRTRTAGPRRSGG